MAPFIRTLVLMGLCYQVTSACIGIEFIDTIGARVNEYHVNVIENAIPGIIALTIESHCLLNTVPYSISYSIKGDPLGFRVENNTLQTADTPALRLGVGKYKLTIQASTIVYATSVPVFVNISSGAESNLTFISKGRDLHIFMDIPVGTLVWTVTQPDVYLELMHDARDRYFRLSPDKRSLLVLRSLRFAEDYFVYALRRVVVGLPNSLALNINIWPATAPIIHDAVCTRTHIIICWREAKFGRVARYQIDITARNLNLEQSGMEGVQSGRLLCASLTTSIKGPVRVVIAAVTHNGVLGMPSEPIDLTPSQCSSSMCGCMNGGTCVPIRRVTSSVTLVEGGSERADDDDLYACECSPEYTGHYCERSVQSGCTIIQCRNGGTCTDTELGPTCQCSDNFTGALCETMLQSCPPQYCLNDGDCVQSDEGTIKCRCLRGHSGMRCENVAHCPSDREIRLTGVITWASTRFDSAAKIPCVAGVLSPREEGSPIVHAYKQCELITDQETSWRPSNFSQCPQGVASRETAGSVLDAIADGEFLSKSDVDLVFLQDILANLTDISALDRNLSYRFFKAVDVLADPVYTDTRLVTEKLLSTIQTFMGKMDMRVNETFNATLPNIEVAISRLARPMLDQGLTFQGQQLSDQPVASISLPPEVFEKSDRSDFLVKFGLIKNVKLFPASRAPNKTVGEVGVLVATVRNLRVQDLATCITYRFPIAQMNQTSNYECVFLNKQSNTWSNRGIERIRLDERYIECCSHHLTNFAILLDVNPDVKVTKEHETALSIISYIGVALAIFGLCLTIITYGLFPCLRHDKSGQILLNLCSAMLLMDCFFLVGVERQNMVNDDACAAVAAILHYSLLATMAWMSIEAFHLYRLLIKVFAIYENYFLIKRAIVAWGVPLVLVIISMAVDISNYKHPDNESCFISADNPGLYYGTLIAPVCLTLVFNIIVFGLVLKVVLRRKFDHPSGKRTVSATQIRGILSVMTLLGISWLFGTLAIGAVKTAFQYIFIISTSLQGFCIFVFRCVCHSDARASWLQLVRHGTLKTRRGPGAKTQSSSNTPTGQPLPGTRHNKGDASPLSRTTSTGAELSDMQLDPGGEGEGHYAEIADQIHEERSSIYSVPYDNSSKAEFAHSIADTGDSGTVTSSLATPVYVNADTPHEYWLNKYQ